MAAYSPKPTALSYVDNLELIASTLAAGINCLQTWAELWTLRLDLDKSYVWGTTPQCRGDLTILNWAIRESARDLGAQINYCRKRTIKEQQKRLEGLSPQWHLLSRTWASEFHKYQILYQAFWPKALHEFLPAPSVGLTSHIYVRRP